VNRWIGPLRFTLHLALIWTVLLALSFFRLRHWVTGDQYWLVWLSGWLSPPPWGKLAQHG
jgi:hypothetical protein